MISSNSLKKLVSISAAILLAVGGSLVASQPASALDVTAASVVLAPQGGSNSISVGVTGCSIDAFATPPSTPQASDFTVTGNAGALPVSTVTLGSYISLSMASPLVGGDQLTISYVKSGTSANQIKCLGGSNTVGTFSGVTTTVTSAPAAPVLTASQTTNLTTSSATLNFSSSAAGPYFYSVRAASSAAPTASYLAASSWGVLDLQHGSSTLMAPGATTAVVNGLAASTSYVAYVMQIGQGGNSSVLPISFMTSSGGGGTSPCSPSITVTSISYSGPSIDPSTTVRKIFNGDSTIGTSTPCAANAFVNSGYLSTLNGVVVGTPVYSPSITLSISNLATTWSALTNSQALTGRTIHDGDVYTVSYFVGLGRTPTISDSPTFSYSLILYPSGIPAPNTPPTVSSQPTIAISGTNMVATQGTYSSGSVMPNWEYCDVAQAAITVPVNNSMSAHCQPLFLTANGGGYSNVAHATTLDLNATYYSPPIGSMQMTMSPVNLADQFVRWHEFIGSYEVATATTQVSGSNNQQQQQQQSSSQSTFAAPVWQAPLIKQVPNLSKSLSTNGGLISLKDDAFSGLKSVTVGGKPVNVTIGSNGSVTIPVPAGQTGSADLTLTFDSGTITIINGIKYVAPTDVAKVAERPVAIAAGSKKITEAIADQIRQAAFANMTNTNIQCVAYSANNSAKAKAAAELTAVQACGIAAKANPALKIADVTVIVDKAKARKAAVGIKVYKN